MGKCPMVGSLPHFLSILGIESPGRVFAFPAAVVPDMAGMTQSCVQVVVGLLTCSLPVLAQVRVRRLAALYPSPTVLTLANPVRQV